MNSKLLIPLFLLIPAVYFGGKVIGNQFRSDTPAQAVQSAQNFVKLKLLCPATAKFPAAEAKAVDGQWAVSSHVDSQNAQGATVRTYWLAMLENQGGEFKLIDLSMTTAADFKRVDDLFEEIGNSLPR